ncbi:MarR family winged helix-turn-helix transcriptional regulator [Terrabacter sp. MAHUQ-38]|jgi:DNA-binding MarR family transcriptional regulator|uniref:MarR family winged helix-turn-helix transcriptional regulator n=1 Tax=unclassified Terrabacter TaxID=2630222 RepID=UPI00165E4736|nr:MarR family transcriptional regulator [Terrabacter sp. MAHUQ-38]MBC9819680.1 MarR family transcriptional regulator [Terrabacter sp. MAHUQ-38]
MTSQLSVGVLMFIAARDVENRVIEAMRRAGVDDITVAQGRVAARIGPHGTRLSDLAEQAQVTKQTATALVDRLEAAGYVERVPDPRDGRARLVRFTAKGEAMLPVARAEEQQVEREWEQHLGARRMRDLRESLTLLREITDPYQEPADV